MLLQPAKAPSTCPMLYANCSRLGLTQSSPSTYPTYFPVAVKSPALRADTNPPFSLFREFISQLVKYNKKFLIIGNVNAITYKEIFPLIIENKMWLGSSLTSGDLTFIFNVPDNYSLDAAVCGIDDDGKRYIQLRTVRWFTNLEHNKRHQPLDLYKKYSSEEFPKYDNYDAININKTADIPYDYEGVMGVPITFLDKYCPEQFEIIKFRKGDDDKDLSVNGKRPYFRILIKKSNNEN